jgi:hypothetical protein
MNIQFPGVHLHILPDPIEQYTLEEDSYFVRLEIRDKDLCAGIRSVRGPFGRFGKCDQLSPVWEGGQDLECFGQWTGFVSR